MYKLCVAAMIFSENGNVSSISNFRDRLVSLSAISVLFFLLHFLGVVLICACLFLYEDEEGKIQNKIEEWWVRLSDIQKASRSKVASFMREVARLTGSGFDRLFGHRLFSLRVIPVSIYLSLASLFLLILLTVPRTKYSAGTSRQAAFGMFFYFLALALVPAFFRNKWILAVWWTIIPAVVLSASGFLVFVFKTRGVRSTFYGIGLLVLIFISSLLCDLVYIAMTRYILRRIAGIDHIPEIFVMIFLNLLVLVIPILGPVYGGAVLAKYAPQAGAMVLFSIMFNAIDVLGGLAALLLAMFLLLHRLAWPAIQRPLYAIYRFAPVNVPLKEKRWMYAIGLALLFLPYHLSFAILRAILEKL